MGGKEIFMNSEELKNSIENARIEKGISQRELAKLSGISRSTLNDLINGKVKKIDVESLKRIAEILNISLVQLLKDAGYDTFLEFLSRDNFRLKSSTDLINTIKQYDEFKMDILDWDYQKRKNALNVRKQIEEIKNDIKILEAGGTPRATYQEVIEKLEKINEELKDVAKKYDYSKLPDYDKL